MKIAIVNNSDSGGGAANAGWHLHRGFIENGIDSRLVVANATRGLEDKVFALEWEPRFLDRLWGGISWRAGLTSFPNAQVKSLAYHEQIRDADVVNVHLLHGGTYNLLAIREMARHKPVLLTLHDMWNFTGHCAYSEGCEKWKTGCGSCPKPEVYPAIKRDGTSIEWRLKKWIFDSPYFSVVAISSWIESCISISLLGNLKRFIIPNGIDLSRYDIDCKSEARQAFEIPETSFVLTFVAARLSDPRKGLDILINAIQMFPESERRNFHLLLIGDIGDQALDELPCEYTSLGFVSDDNLKRRAYAAANWTAVPSREDNLPVIIQESQACGVPVIARAVGGIADLIQSDVNGILVETPTESLFEGLKKARSQKLEKSAVRDSVEQTYSRTMQAKRYLKVISDLHSTRAKSP